MSTLPARTADPPRSEPAWDIAKLYPDQGYWSERDYLALSTNHLVEFTRGYVEVLPMPTQRHQLIVAYFFEALRAFIGGRKLGRVLFAALRVRLESGKYREPDVVFMLAEHASRMGNEYWEGADLVMEVVSEDGRQRDLEEKRRDYALAGIPEYWIVDPREQSITVLTLSGKQYIVAGEAHNGQKAASVLLKGFEIDVTAALSAE
jgi:Uma2 family endonuclease